MPASISRIPAAIGPPKSAEIAEKAPAIARTLWWAGSTVHEVCDRQADCRPSAIQGAPRAEHGAEGQRADGCEGHARGVGDWRRRDAPKPSTGRWPPSPGRKPARGEHDRRADGRKQDHEVPWRRVVAERVRQVVPEPVLELVDER